MPHPIRPAQAITPARRLLLLRATAAALLPGAVQAQSTAILPMAELAKPGRVLMLRHANAPGIGDPPGFKLGDCSTQRVLDAAGRAQAKRLGERIAQAGVTAATVYSSQWCRCLETARLLALGAPIELASLNSFFDRSANREGQVAEVRRFLHALPKGASLVVMVTHQVMITAFTRSGIASGAGAVFELVPDGEPRLIGEIAAV